METQTVDSQELRVEPSPNLHPEEHAWIEELTGKTLTNEEAQTLLREAKLTASWADVYGKRERKFKTAGR